MLGSSMIRQAMSLFLLGDPNMDSKVYAELGLKAAKRAAKKVRKDAFLYQRRIPVWVNGKKEFKIPENPDAGAVDIKSDSK